MNEAIKQPKNWKEMSFDMRLFFIFHGSMMALMLAHFALRAGIIVEISVVSLLAIVGVVLSIHHRWKQQWRWPGTKPLNVVGALLSVLLGLYFMGAVLPGNSILNPNLFPWLAAGTGLIAFVVLSGLGVVQQSEAEFQRYCGEGRLTEPAQLSAPATPKLTGWKRAVCAVLAIYGLAVWIGAVGFHWKFNSAYAGGSKTPTATQTERLSNHGRTVYINPEEKQMVKLLELALLPGIPSLFVIALILHFGLGIKMYSKKEESA